MLLVSKVHRCLRLVLLPCRSAMAGGYFERAISAVVGAAINMDRGQAIDPQALLSHEALWSHGKGQSGLQHGSRGGSGRDDGSHRSRSYTRSAAQLGRKGDDRHAFPGRSRSFSRSRAPTWRPQAPAASVAAPSRYHGEGCDSRSVQMGSWMGMSNDRGRSRSRASTVRSSEDGGGHVPTPPGLPPRGHRAGRHRDTWARRAKVAQRAAESGAAEAEQAMARAEALAEKARNAERAADQAQHQRSQQRAPAYSRNGSQPATPTRPPLGARQRSPPPSPPQPQANWQGRGSASKGKGKSSTAKGSHSKGKGKGKGSKTKSHKKQAKEDDQSWGTWHGEGGSAEHFAATSRIGRAAPVACTFHESISRDVLQLLRYGATRTHLGVFRHGITYDLDDQGLRYRTVHLQKLDYSNDGFCLASTLAKALQVPLGDLLSVAHNSRQPQGGKHYFRTKEGVDDLLIAPANPKGYVPGAVAVGE